MSFPKSEKFLKTNFFNCENDYGDENEDDYSRKISFLWKSPFKL